MCTEKSTKKSCSSYLGNVMKSLFDICTSSDCSELARVHALNILKTLFKNAQLGEEVLIYVETAIIIAMDGIKSSYWPVILYNYREFKKLRIHEYLICTLLNSMNSVLICSKIICFGKFQIVRNSV